MRMSRHAVPLHVPEAAESAASFVSRLCHSVDRHWTVEQCHSVVELPLGGGGPSTAQDSPDDHRGHPPEGPLPFGAP